MPCEGKGGRAGAYSLVRHPKVRSLSSRSDLSSPLRLRSSLLPLRWDTLTTRSLCGSVPLMAHALLVRCPCMAHSVHWPHTRLSCCSPQRMGAAAVQRCWQEPVCSGKARMLLHHHCTAKRSRPGGRRQVVSNTLPLPSPKELRLHNCQLRARTGVLPGLCHAGSKAKAMGRLRYCSSCCSLRQLEEALQAA